MSRRLNRRRFIRRSAAAAGAVAVGLYLPTVSRAADDSKWGDLTGKFYFNSKPFERKKLKVDKDVECCGKFDIRDESLMVGTGGGLGNVYVYVRTRSVDVCPELEAPADKQVVLDNLDCIFVPHCLKIWYTVQELSIVNSDPVAQNVAFSPLGDVPANLILPLAKPDAQTKAAWKFSRKQNVPVPIACNYHPWESAHILPRDNPYVDITKMDGTFTIPKLPVGELEFQVWHEKVGYLETPQWPRGRFKMTIKPGTNDLGMVKISPKWLVKE